MMQEETGGPLGKFTGSVEVPGRPEIGSVGCIYMGNTCGASSFTFGDAGVIVVGSEGLSGDNSSLLEATHFLDVGARVLEGEGVASPALWTHLVIRFTS